MLNSLIQLAFLKHNWSLPVPTEHRSWACCPRFKPLELNRWNLSFKSEQSALSSVVDQLVAVHLSELSEVVRGSWRHPAQVKHLRYISGASRTNTTTNINRNRQRHTFPPSANVLVVVCWYLKSYRSLQEAVPAIRSILNQEWQRRPYANVLPIHRYSPNTTTTICSATKMYT